MVGSHKVNINLNPQTISTFLDTVVIENKFKSKPKFLRSSQQLKLTVNWSKILQEGGFLRSDLKINHPALLMACIKGDFDSVLVFYEAGFHVVSQLGQTGW